jgi:CHAT domain-containing protein
MMSFQRLLSAAQQNPLARSGLAFAGANTLLQGGNLPPEAEDGLLTAQGASGINLAATALVVASACQTALGNVLIGEGVLGLRRAFVLAGGANSRNEPVERSRRSDSNFNEAIL